MCLKNSIIAVFLFCSLVGNSNIVFAQSLQKVPFASDSIISAKVIIADIDNNGFLDILERGCANDIGIILNIYYNQGDYEFELRKYSPPSNFIVYHSLGNYDVNVRFTASDINNDNVIDLFIDGVFYNLDQNKELVVIGNIEIPSLYDSNESFYDLDSDGDMDLVYTGRTEAKSNTIIYLNSNGEFGEGIELAQGHYGSSISLFDTDNDSRKELFVGGSDNNGNSSIYVYSTVDEQFELKRRIYCPVDNGNFKIIDLNRDSIPDLLYAGSSSAGVIYSFLHGDANPILLKEFDDSYHAIKSHIENYDFNEDGLDDLLIMGPENQNEPEFSIFQNTGNSFEEVLVDNQGRSRSFTIADLNNDRIPEIIRIGQDTIVLYGGYLSRSPSIVISKILDKTINELLIPSDLTSKQVGNEIMLSWADTGYLNTSYNLKIGTNKEYMDVMSPLSNLMNGKRTIAAQGNALLDTTYLLKNLEAGTYFWSVQSINNDNIGSNFAPIDSFIVKPKFELLANSFSMVHFTHASLCDFDQDGDYDVLLSDQDSSKLFLNHLNMEFHITDDVFRSSAFTTTDWGDYDNDGDMDIVLKQNHIEYGLYIYENRDSEFFEILVDSYVDEGVSWLDIDNDGDLDIVTASRSYINENKAFQLGYSIQNSNWQDIDNDYDFDIITPTSIYFNDNNEFTSHGEWNDLNNGTMAFNDIDFDQDLDVFLFGESGGYNVSRVYINNKGNLDESEISIEGYPCNTTTVCDIDNNGASNIIIPISARFINHRIIEFRDGKIYEEEIPAINLGHVCGDMDNDSDNDLIWFSGGNDRIFRVNGSSLNTPPSIPQNLKVNTIKYNTIFKWDESLDNESVEGGLSYNLRLGTSPGGFDVVSPGSNVNTGYRYIPKSGNCQLNKGWRLDELPVGTYYWSVQAVDQGFMGGEWAPEHSFTVSVVRSDFEADTICSGIETRFTDLTVTSGDLPINWEWDFGDGTISSLQNPTHLYSTADTFDVQLISGSNQYSDTIVKQVIVKPKPGADFLVEAVCHGDPSLFSNQANLNGLITSYWNWDFGDNQSSDLSNPDPHYYAQAGSYIAKLTVGSDNGCFDTISKMATVARYPLVQISANGPVEMCEDESVMLQVEENENFAYQWKLDDIPLTDSVFHKCEAIFNGQYSVDVLNTLAACMSSSLPVGIKKIEKPIKPVIVTHGFSPENCPNSELISIEVQDATSLYNYQWKKNGILLEDGTDPKYEAYLDEGNYTVEASIGKCNTTSDESKIFFNNSPLLKPEIVARGSNVWYLASTNDSAAFYRWYFEDQLISKANQYIYIAGQDLGKYEVSISDNGHCYSKSDPHWIPEQTGIEANDPWDNIRIYPNPTPGLFTLEMDNPIMGQLRIDITNENGIRVIRIEFLKETSHFITQIDLSEQPAALYLIGMTLDEYKTTRRLVVK